MHIISTIFLVIRFPFLILILTFFLFQLPELISSISEYARKMSKETTEPTCDQTCNVDFATEDDVPEILEFLKIHFFKVIFY